MTHLSPCYSILKTRFIRVKAKPIYIGLLGSERADQLAEAGARYGGQKTRGNERGSEAGVLVEEDEGGGNVKEGAGDCDSYGRGD